MTAARDDGVNAAGADGAADTRSRARLRERMHGFAISQCLYVATALGIPDRLRGGAATCDTLAAETRCDPDALRRVLRALAGIGVVAEDARGAFALTAEGALLASDANNTVAAEVQHMLGPSSWRAWGDLLESVRTGRAAFPRIFGEDAWSYRARNAEAGGAFAAMMTEVSRREMEVALDHIDLSAARRVVDVGGAHGVALAAVLARNSRLTGILFDRADVVAGANDTLERAGVLDRCKLVAGDFFTEVPRGGDVYLLKSILHNWDDDDAGRILASCRRAMAPGAALVVIEPVRGPATHDDASSSILDLHMLVIHGGRQRAIDEHRALLAAAGFALTRHAALADGPAIIEARPA